MDKGYNYKRLKTKAASFREAAFYTSNMLY